MGGGRSRPGRRATIGSGRRAVEGLTGLAWCHKGGTVVVVSRDAVNREVLVAFDRELGDPDALPQDNGCFNTLEWRDGRWAVISVNELPTQQ